MVSLIVAYDRGRGIGKDNKMPWHLPGELAYFKRTTMGKPIIMGRNTFESIGKPLPGRRNMVVSRQLAVQSGVEVFATLDAALQACTHETEVMVIGGGQLYAAALPRAMRIFATEIDAEFGADTFFPPLDRSAWEEASRTPRPADEKNPYALDYVVYERR